MLWSIWLMESTTEGFQISALLFLHWAHILMRCFFPSFFQIRLNRKKASQKLFCFVFCLFLVVSSLTCTLKKSCHFILPKFHLFPFLPFIHSNLPLKHWPLFNCFSLLFFFSPSDNIAQGKGKLKIFFFLPVLSSCFICYLHLKKKAVILCYLNSIFSLSYLYPYQPSPKTLASCQLFFSFFSSSDNIALEKGKSIFFHLFLFYLLLAP